ncbi:hypothetical protein BABINDRAFT_9868 [Babjeviella inositovora NRRL Y-12698]|uniref:Protein transport protein BOS1 n=1 Tax=Babjeviella inositovora NRRL Y-12698 TaxID=984486 RepID=A0A1E3QJL8_9ASCO|nr:uncharacterized protein BABINDRAFT_9868 [Babjeviella inositovora NRRL Y-12698]ODQ77891.1 hypothetical protein BABINDRAFT_9868 [Babjeviella inositovora NRRL Y-12698]
MSACTDMNVIYNSALKQTTTLRRDLTSFDENVATAPLSLQGQITSTLTALTRTVDEYADLVKQEVNSDKKAKAEGRLERFRTDIDQSRKEFQRLKNKRDETLQEANRSELLGRRTQATASDNPYSTSTPYQGQQQQFDMSYTDGLAKERDTISLGNQQLDFIIAQASESLDHLVEQNETLQKMQVTMHQTLETLGVSRQTIRYIEKKCWQDKWIFYIGALFTIVSFYYMIKWFK